MDSQHNFDVNNLFNTGLEPNLHPLLASTTVFPGIPTTTSPSSLYIPVDSLPIYHAPLSLTGTNNLTSIPVIQPIASGISLSNLFATAVNQDTLLKPVTPPKIFYTSAAITIAPAPLQPIHNFAIQAGGIVTFNGKSDLDGNPLDLSDDAFVYAGKGFTLNGNSILPVQRNAAGTALTDSTGKLKLVDQALVVAPGYIQSSVNGNNNYTNLNPPQIVATQAIVVPSFADTKQQELATRIPAGAVTTSFNIQQNPINNATQWGQKFPPAGTVTQPKIVRVTSGGLNIPPNVNLSNYVIIVDSGDINFNGSSTLTNVVLVASNGNVNLNQIQTENSSILASGRINANSTAKLGGNTLLANGQGDVTLNGATTGSTSLQNLRIVSQGQIVFNGTATVRGDFRSVGTFKANGSADIYGTVASQQDIVFNGNSTFTYANTGTNDTTPPTITAQLTVDTGSSNSDKITNNPTVTGKVTDASPIATLKAGFNSTVAANWLNVTTNLQADGSFTFTPTQLNQIYGSNLPDGTHTLHLSATDSKGNQSSFDYTFTLDTTIGIPSLQLATASDTGASNSDKITKINTPTISGTGEIGATIKLADGSNIVGQATVGTDGKWQVVTSALTNGNHSLIATATDLAGNISTASAPLNLVIDALLPQLTLTTPLDLNPLKNNAKLLGTISGTGSNLVGINYRWDNSTNLITINPNATGGFDQPLDFTGITNGTHQITITATDIAGNILTSNYNVTVAIDKTAPVITAQLASDTGTSNTDQITFTPTISGTITDASQIAGFKASFDGVNYVNILAQKQANGTFTLAKAQLETIAGKALIDGSYTLRLIATDEFGNASQNYDTAFTLDTTITVPGNLKLATASDTGASNSDNITQINTPTISGTGEIGATIKINDGGNLVATATVGTDGKWQVATSLLTNGNHSLIATATDLAGNISTASAPLNLVIDALLPQLTLTTPLTQTALKNDARLLGTIDGTGSNLVGVNYSWDNSTTLIPITPNAIGGFNQPLDFTGINNGNHTLTISATDIAGNILTSNYTVKVDLDKIAPIVNLQLAADTGGNTSDKITNNPTVTGKVTDTSGISAVTVSLNTNLNNSINIVANLQPDGTFSLDKAVLTQLNGGQLPDGNYQVYLQAVDNYGNTTVPQVLAFQLLTQAIAPTNLQLLASSDTGVSNSDKITKTNQPGIQGNGRAGDTIQLIDGNVLVGTTIVGNDGTWQINSSALADGTHNLTATATDLAGNISVNSTPVNIQIDSLAPQLTLTQVLDNAILVNNAKLTGVVNGSGSNLTNISYQWDNSGNQISITPNSTGNFDQGLDFTGINNGVHVLTITATDTAGNILAKNYNVNTALDKAAPVITAQLANDTGASNSDKITFNPTVSGTISDASQIAGFKASFDGVNYVSILSQKQADGTFTLDKTQLATVAGTPLIDGNYTLHLIATDEFGNVSQSYDTAFKLDTTITVPANLKLAVGGDTGVSNSDNITKINTPIITGTGEIGATIKLTEGTVLIGQTTVGTDGTWQITSSQLTNGNHRLTATAIDLAGNISNGSAPLALVIDALLPQLTLTTPIDLNPLTNTAKLSGNIDGTGTNLASINYRWDNRTNLIAINPNATGGFDQPLDFTGINSGTHSLTITATDVAGNIATNTYNVNVASNLVAPVIALKLATDTGISNSDGITNNATIGGKVTTLGILTGFKVSLDGTNYTDITASVQPDGQFTLSTAQLATIAGKQLTDGNYNLRALATDGLGNVSAQSTNLSFSLDTTNPLLALTTPTATGTYSSTVPLRGTGSDNLQLSSGEYQIDGKPAVAYSVNSQGKIDLNLAPTDLTPGSHRIDVRLTDIAGNTTTSSLDFTTSNNFTISPSQTPGWGVTTANSIALSEGKSLVTQTSIPVTLGTVTGQKIVEFDVKAIFDLSDKTTASADQFAVYLVDTTNNHKTLLDKGVSGTALFTLIGDKAEFAKGIVQYNGTHVKIDLSKIPNAPANGELVFQLLNSDLDAGSTVNIDNIKTSLNPSGIPGSLINIPTPYVTSGGAVDLTGYTPNLNAKLRLTNTRFDAVTGKYTADLQVQNIGTTALPRQLAVLFQGLPPGVTLDAASGSDATGVPYLNLKTAIQAGGLAAGEVSTAITVTFSDPSLIQFGLNPVFMAGAADVPLTLNNLGTLTVRPGEKLALPLIGTDPNGDPIVLSIESTGNLPTGKLTADHNLVFNPRPDQIGTYTFILIAKQGNLVTKQNVTLNVIPDPIVTTRISGVIQGTNAAPLAGLTINVGGTLATTGTDGSFTLELPPTNTATTLTVSGNGYSSLTGKFTTLLGHDLYSGTNNQLGQPISVLSVDPASGITSNPTQIQTITAAGLPLAAVTIDANTATDANGQPYSGKLTLLEVPVNKAPITLPDTLRPDVLATLQGDVNFTAPVTVTLPNRAGYTAGTKLDLWALSSITGSFEKVGQGQVSSDGTVVNTISGGIKNSTWFCFAPVAIAPIAQADNPYNANPTVVAGAQASTPINSSASLQSGAVMETVDVLSYQSLGVNRTVSLHYDSLHADSKEIIHFGYSNYQADGNSNQLIAKLTIRRGDFDIEIPTKQWYLPTTSQQGINAGIQVDLSDQPTGVYQYDLTIGVQRASGEILYGTTTHNKGQLVHVNTTNSQFGSGWSLVGLQELVVNSDKSVLWTDGDGSRAVFVPGTTVNGITSYSASLGDFSKLEKLPDGKYRRTLKDQTVSIFGTNGKLQTVTDRDTNVTTYTFVGDKISEITDPQGLKTTFKPNEISSHDGRSAALYFGDKNLTSIRYADGSSYSNWTYDEHRMTTATDQNGNTGTDDYDELGRVRAATRKDGSEVTIQPADVVGVVLQTSTSIQTITPVPVSTLPENIQIDGNGNVVKKTLDQYGQTVEVSDSIGIKVTTSRDRNGNIIKTIDGENRVTSYTYDDRNNLTGITYGDLGNVPTANVPPFDNTNTAYSVTNFANAFRPTQIATGDINGDGIADIVEVTSDGRIATFLGRSDGNLTLQQTFSLKTFGLAFTNETPTAKKVMISDINGDGVKDIVIGYNKYNLSTGFTPAIVGAILGNGTGSFTSNNYNIYAITNTYNAFDNFTFDLSDFVLGDFNGDGKLDIAATNSQTNAPNLGVYLSNAGGGYSKINTPALRNLNLGGYDSKLAVGDFNGDGKQDLVVTTTNSSYSSTNVRILTSNGDGTFAQAANGYNISGAFATVKVADLNKDGKLDIVVNAGSLGVLLGTGGTNFQLTDYGVTGASFMDVGDINGDGNLDIVTADNSQRLRVLNGKGDGTFTTSTNFYNINATPRGLALGDLNGDGKLDVAIADLNAGLNIKLNQSVITPPVVNTQKKFTYDTKFNQLTSVVDEIGRKTIYEIDASNGDRLSETRIVGTEGGDDDIITRYTYNNHGQILTMKDGKNQTTTYNYGGNISSSSLGQLSSIVNALGDTTNYTYDLAGNRNSVSVQRENGYITTDYEYDELNRLKKAIGAQTDTSLLRSETEYLYYKNGQIRQLTDPNGNTTKYEYDKLDRLTRVTDGEGNLTISHYDLAGNLDYTINGKVNINSSDNTPIIVEGVTSVTRYEYDDRKRLKKVINPDLTYREMTYDLADNIKTITDENQRTTTKKYDARNRLVEEIDAKGKSTFYTLDDASQLKEVKDARGKVTKYEYDDLGRKTTTTAPIDITTTAVTKIEYDKNSNVTAIIDANAILNINDRHRTDYQYDALNRRIGATDALNKTTVYSYDKVGNLTLVKDANNHSTSYVYDNLNRQTKITNALQQSTDTTYDLAGNVKTVTAPTGHLVSYSYDQNNRRTITSDERGIVQIVRYNEVGQIQTVTDAIGNKITNTYDTRNRLTHVTDDFGADTETRYDNVGNISAIIDARQNQIDYKYDENNRRIEVIKKVGGQPFSEKGAYDEVGNIVSTTDGEGRIVTYVYDDSNRRTKATDLLNHSTYTEYDRVGNITKVTDAKGRVTNYEYDALNRQTAVTQAVGTVDQTTTGYGYDAVGNLTSETDGRNYPLLAVADGNNHSTKYTYDALNRRIATTDIYNDVTKTEYYDTPTLIATAIALELPTIIDTTNIGKIVKQIDANNHSTLSVYDLQGRLTDTYDGSKHLTSHQTYYKDDRIKTATDTFGKITTYTYNDTLRQTKMVNPLELTTTKTYDKVGNLTNVTDSQDRTTEYSYDELNRQKTIKDAEKGTTAYTYYNDGQIKTIQDAVNNTNNTISNTTTYTYDEVGRLSKENTALGDRIYGYDEVNNRISTKDRNLRTTNYIYDNLNRISTETWDGTGKQFTYTYDRNSNRLSADDGSIKYNYAYDNTDLLTQVDRISGTNPTISFQYEYDKVGNLTKADELTGATVNASTAYTYDSRNLNSSIAQTGTGLVSKLVEFTYDAQGQTARIERYLGTTPTVSPQLSTLNTYDTYGRLTAIEQKNSGGVIASSLYEFDNLNRLTSETIDGVNRQIRYDKIDQVKTVTGSNSEAYTYDENGNRKNGGYATGVNNQLLNDGTYSYEYDKEGNRTKRTNTATGAVDNYTWDYRNRLTGVISQDTSAVVTQTVSYEYDVDNQRVSKTVNGVVEKYVIDRDQIAYVTDGSGTQTFHYLYGTNVDAVMAQDSPTGMVWSLSDRLGSVNLLTDAGGVVVNKRTFDSFGRVLSETNPGVKFRYGYTGRETDGETGLDYYRARYYDAANGRFISVDPIGFGAGDTNLYRYVGNSSTMYTDPSGNLKLYEGNPLVDGLNFASTVFNFTYGLPNNIASLVSGNGFAANPFSDAAKGLQQVPGIDNLNVSVKFDAGEKYGDAAAQYYSQQFNDSNTPLWQKPGYLAGGLLSSLWTTDTSDATFAVLFTALTGAKDVQKLGLLAEGKYAGLKLGGAFDGLTQFERGVETGIGKAASFASGLWNKTRSSNSNLLSNNRGASERVQEYWNQYHETVGSQGDDLTSLIKIAQNGTKKRVPINVNTASQAAFDMRTGTIEVASDTKKWEFFEEFLHKKVSDGWKKNEILELTKSLRKVKGSSGKKSVSAPATAAEEIVVKQWLMTHGKIVGVGEAEQSLLQNQINQLKNYGLSRGY
jgi:RHS repeat-associated protein